MSKSPLATVFVAADPSNYTKGRSKVVTDITIHHMAGRCTAQRCGEFWQDPARNASSTYGIGYNGEIGCYLDENDTPWTNSNWDSNCRSITIEVANEYKGGDWKVTDASLNSLIKLVADIAKRRGLGTLVKGKNVTWHSMFANTNCPGPYLLSKMDYIVSEANKLINGKPEPTPEPEKLDFKVGDKVYIEGPLYVSSNEATASGHCSGKVTEITRVKAGAAHPYNTTGDLGWMDASSVKAYEEPVKPEPVTPVSTEIKPGDSVIVNGVGKSDSAGKAGARNTKNFTNRTMKVIRVKKGANYPYACNQYNEGNPEDISKVTGWFSEDSVKKV